MTPGDIELSFIREFSTAGNLIGKTASKTERRERVRQAIYINGRTHDPFVAQGIAITYAEAFRLCYGERLDRRAATRALPEPSGEPDDQDSSDDNDNGEALGRTQARPA